MKLWKKVFLIVFLLFLCCFNMGGFYIIRLVYDTSLKTQIDAITSEACYVGDEIYADLEKVSQHNALRDSNLQDCLWTYGSDLRKRDVYIYYEVKNKVKFNSNSNLEVTKLDWEQSEEKFCLDTCAKIILFSQNNVNYVAVRQEFNGTLKDHTFVYLYSMENYEAQWRQLRYLLPAVEIGIIILLGVSLAVILIHLTKPLNKLSEVAKEVAAGRKAERVKVNGKDEVAVLAENFNCMVEQIEENIEELEKSASQKQRFIDNLGHELRTPLTSISGYAEYLKMAQVSEEDKLRALGYITSEGHRLQKLSNTLLDLALLRTDAIEMKELPVHDLLELMQIGFRDPMKQKKLSLITETEIETVYGNFELLCSLMVNLIENASRACFEGGSVTVRFQYAGEQQHWVKLCVIDNGTGIQKKDIDKVVEPFYRVDKARSRDMGGVGLGSTLCQQIVQAHKGTMQYESETGKGTCVTVILKDLQVEHNFLKT